MTRCLGGPARQTSSARAAAWGRTVGRAQVQQRTQILSLRKFKLEPEEASALVNASDLGTSPAEDAGEAGALGELDQCMRLRFHISPTLMSEPADYAHTMKLLHITREWETDGEAKGALASVYKARLK